MFYVGTYVVFQVACRVHQALCRTRREVHFEGRAEPEGSLGVRSHYNFAEAWKGKQKETFTSIKLK